MRNKCTRSIEWFGHGVGDTQAVSFWLSTGKLAGIGCIRLELTDSLDLEWANISPSDRKATSKGAQNDVRIRWKCD
jgi:hypothetical protein